MTLLEGQKPVDINKPVKQMRREAKVLIIEGNAQVVKFLKINLENVGYRVAAMPDVAQTLADAQNLNEVDVVALAATELESYRDPVNKLRKALGRPIVVYDEGSYCEEERRVIEADGWISHFHEPGEFLKAIEAVLKKSWPEPASQ